MRREDVLDLALGHYTRDEVLARAKIIQEKHDAHWSSLPPFLSKRSTEPFDFTDPNMAKPLHALQIMVLRNGRRSNELLLQRGKHIPILKTACATDHTDTRNPQS